MAETKRSMADVAVCRNNLVIGTQYGGKRKGSKVRLSPIQKKVLLTAVNYTTSYISFFY